MTTTPTSADSPVQLERVAPTPYLPTASLIIVVVAVVGSIIDVILAKGALDVVLNETEFNSAITAIGIAAVAVGMAVSAGLAIRHGHRHIGVAVGMMWLLIGVALAYMRWNKGTLDGDIENTVADQVLAILMLAVYVAAGIEVAIHGSRLLAADAYFRTRSARRAVNRRVRRRTEVAAQYARVSLALQEFSEKRARAARQEELAQNTITQLERELMAFARDRIAEALPGPETTGLIRQPIVVDVDVAKPASLISADNADHQRR